MSGHTRGRQWRVLMWLVSVFICMIVIMSQHSRGRQWRVLMWLVLKRVCMYDSCQHVTTLSGTSMACPHVVGKRVCMYDSCQHVTTLSGTSMACPHVVGKRVCMYDCCNMSEHSWGRQWRVLMWLVSVFVCMIVVTCQNTLGDVNGVSSCGY